MIEEISAPIKIYQKKSGEFFLIEFNGIFEFEEDFNFELSDNDLFQLEEKSDGIFQLVFKNSEELIGKLTPLKKPILVCQKNSEGILVNKILESKIVFNKRPEQLFGFEKKKNTN